MIEVNPDTNEIEWTYEGNPAVSFFSSYISGADRLPNGNTLICEGAHGRLFEVTHHGEIVWEFINPFFAPDSSGRNLSNAIFRAHRYAPEFSGFTGRDLDPAPLRQPQPGTGSEVGVGALLTTCFSSGSQSDSERRCE